MAYPTIPLEKIEKIVELTQKGWSRYKIAREVKCSISTVYKYQKEYGLI